MGTEMDQVYSLRVQVEKLQVALRRVTLDRDDVREKLQDSHAAQQECLQALLIAREQLLQFQDSMHTVRDYNQQLVEDNMRLRQQCHELQQQLREQHEHQQEQHITQQQQQCMQLQPQQPNEQRHQLLGLLGATGLLGADRSSSTGSSSCNGSRDESGNNSSSSCSLAGSTKVQPQWRQQQQQQEHMQELQQRLDVLHRLPMQRQAMQQHNGFADRLDVHAETQCEPQCEPQYEPQCQQLLQKGQWQHLANSLQANQPPGPERKAKEQQSAPQQSSMLPQCCLPAAEPFTPAAATPAAVVANAVCLTPQDLDFVLGEIQLLQQQVAMTAAKLEALAPAVSQQGVQVQMQQCGLQQQTRRQQQQQEQVCLQHTSLGLLSSCAAGLAQGVAAYSVRDSVVEPAVQTLTWSQQGADSSGTGAVFPQQHIQTEGNKQPLAQKMSLQRQQQLVSPCNKQRLPWNYQGKQQQPNAVRLRKRPLRPQHQPQQHQSLSIGAEQRLHTATLLTSIEAAEQLACNPTAISQINTLCSTKSKADHAVTSVQAMATRAAARVPSACQHNMACHLVTAADSSHGAAATEAADATQPAAQPACCNPRSNRGAACLQGQQGNEHKDPRKQSAAAQPAPPVLGGVCNVPAVDSSSGLGGGLWCLCSAQAANQAALLRYMKPVARMGPRTVRAGMQM